MTSPALSRTTSANFTTLLSNDAARTRVNQVEAAGVTLDKFGLVTLGGRLKEIESKVAPNLQEGRSRIQTIINEGKTVLLFPGAFDLLHVGHASYILQGIETFLRSVPKMKRADLFVVAALDSDSLIASTKSGAENEPPRPIQSEANFAPILGNRGVKNPRATEMASLPFVDLVLVTPSPAEIHSLREDWNFKRWLSEKSSFEGDAKAVILADSSPLTDKVRDGMHSYSRLISKLNSNVGMRFVHEGFIRAQCRLPQTDSAQWDLASWNLMMTRFLGSVTASERGGCYRILSDKDGYSPIVAKLMELSGIRTVLVNDDHVLSTTGLIKTYGWENLFTAKWASLA
jgi:hypothetical protein